MPLKAVVPIPTDTDIVGAAAAAAGTAAPAASGSTTQPYQATTPVSGISSFNSHRTGNAGVPLRSSSASSSFHYCRTTHDCSNSAVGAAAGAGTAVGRTTSPSYRHNPYLASPTSETYLYLASPESLGLDNGGERRSSPRSNSNNCSFDVTSDRRLVVRSRSSRRGVSSPVRSVSDGGNLINDNNNCHQQSSSSRVHNLSPAYMNPLEDQLMAADEVIWYQPSHDQYHHHHARRDSTASLSYDNCSYGAVLCSCTESASASQQASPSPGQIASLIHAPASPLAAAPYARRRTESPSASRHSTLNASNSHGSPEMSSLYYSFGGNHSAAAVMSTSSNPYVLTRINPEATAATTAAAEATVGHDGVSPQRCSTVPRVNKVATTGGNVLTPGSCLSDGSCGANRTPTADGFPVRTARVRPSSSSLFTTPQNSPRAVILNANSSIMGSPRTCVSPTAAAAISTATAAQTSIAGNTMTNNTNNARFTATPCSHRSDTPPPYNQPASASLSPNAAGMIVPPGHLAAMTLHHHHYHHGAIRSEVSTSSQNNSVHPYTPSQGQLQQQWHVATPPPPFMPPLRTANQTYPPRYTNNSNGTYNNNVDVNIRCIHSMASGPPPPASDAAVTTSPTHDKVAAAAAIADHHSNATLLPLHETVSLATTPDQVDVLSDRAPPTQFRTLSATDREGVRHSDNHSNQNSGSGSTASRDDADNASGQPHKETKHSLTSSTTPRTESNFLNSLTSANGMTRTMAGLPEMLMGGSAGTLLAQDDDEVGSSAIAVGAAKQNNSDSVRSQMQQEGENEEDAPATQWVVEKKTQQLEQQLQLNIAEEVSEVEDGVEDDVGSDSAHVRSAATAGKKSKSKKKHARRNRKLKFLEDLPPAVEMKFLPPPPPPLPAPYGDPATAAGTATRIDFDKYYGVLLRWYERILADEADFVQLNYAPPATMTNSNTHTIAGHSVTSLEDSRTTLHNSGTLQNLENFTACTPASTMTGSTIGAPHSSAVFALTNFNQYQQLSTNNSTTVVPTAAASPATRVRRNAGGDEVPVLCPRIEQYMPACDIPQVLKGSAAVATSNNEDRLYSLLSSASNVENAVTAAAASDAAGHEKLKPAADGKGGDKAVTATAASASAVTPLLHVQHVDRAVQWAKDLNWWWLLYVHPHSFNSRGQRIPQAFPLPAAAATATTTQATFPQPPLFPTPAHHRPSCNNGAPRTTGLLFRW